MHTVTDNWKIVTKLDTKPLTRRYEQIKPYVKEVETLCSQRDYAPEIHLTCYNYLNLLTKRMEKLGNRIQHIYEIPTYTQNKRRGLIKGIGSISKTLFGTMDASDVEEISTHFAQVDRKQDALQNAMKKTNTTNKHNTKLSTKRRTNDPT